MNDVIIVDRGDMLMVQRPTADVMAVGGGGGASSAGGITFTQSNVLLGRSSSGAGPGEEIPCNAFGRSVIAATVVAGAILFAASPTAMGSDAANLYWDDANNRLGIGTNNPQASLHVASGQVFSADGTAAAPAYSFGSSPNFGILKVAAGFGFGTAGVLRWVVSTAGHFRPNADNTYDFGTATERPRTLYCGSAQFSGATFPAVGAGVEIAYSAGTGFIQAFDRTGAAWLPLSLSASEVRFAPSTNVVEQRNGANAQAFRIYNTFTDAANYERLDIGWSANSAFITTVAAGTGTARALNIGTEGNVGLVFRINAGSRWHIDAASVYAFRPTADNASDIGTATNRPRSIYVGTNIVVASGGLAAPALQHSGASAVTGLYFRTAADRIHLLAGGIDTGCFNSTGLHLAQLSGLFWSSTSGTPGGVPDVILLRDAANTLAQRNTTNAQAFRIYSTFTDASNYERLEMGLISGTFSVLSAQGGTGVAQQLRVGTRGAVDLLFRTNNVDVWRITSGGVLRTETDNTYDIGVLANRPRSIYWGTQALAPNGTKTAPAYAFASASGVGFYWRVGTFLGLAQGGVESYLFGSAGLNLPQQIGFAASGTDFSTAGPDLTIVREAADQLALRRGLSAQTFWLYNTFTDASNYERAMLRWTANEFVVGTDAAGTGVVRTLVLRPSNAAVEIKNGTAAQTLNIYGTISGVDYERISIIAGGNMDIVVTANGTGLARPLRIRNNTAQGIQFATSNVTRWQFDSVGHILPAADNTYDIGATTPLRPRNIHAAGSITSAGATSGIGYATGAGGTVTQITSKSTGVTLNKVTGQITMDAAALAAGAEVSFTVTNSAVAATDLVLANHVSAGTAGAYIVSANSVGAGAFNITVSNASGGSLSEAIVIGFAIIKGATA